MTDSSAAENTPETAAEQLVDPIAQIARGIWWLVLLRGIFAVLFGIFALFAPLTTIFALVIVFAAYAFVDGIVEIVHAVQVRQRDQRWGWLLAQGIISVLAGIVAFIFPGAAGLVGGLFLLSLIAFYAVLMGIAGFPAAAAVTSTGRKVLGYIVAVLSIVLGIALAIIVLVDPAGALLNLIWVVGVYAIIFGVMLVVAAIQARATKAPASTEVPEPKVA